MKGLIPILILALCVAGLVFRSQAAALTESAARDHLKSGAVLVDVRTRGEFAEKSLPGAVNLPLDTVRAAITNHVTNKSQVVLLHCRTGRRSGIAEQELRALGYTNAFNLGSFEQAQKVVEAKDR
jgi:phage shock protein E